MKDKTVREDKIKWKIPLFKIYWTEEDVKEVERVIRSGMYWATGSQIEEFENRIKEYLDAKYCLTFNSGGSALYALMLAYKFGPSDEIIVPSFTFIATAYAPLYVGAKSIFADVELETFGLDPEDVKKKITSKTKGVIPIHYGGMPCKIEELKEVAEDHNLVLIEDVAESFGAKFKGKCVGTFGESAIFSFCQNKVFTTGEGGCVVTNNKKIYERLKLIRSYGRVTEGNYFLSAENADYIEIGHNFRIPTLLAALGISQLANVDKAIKMRRKNAEYLNRNLAKVEGIIVPEPPSNSYFAVYQMYTIRVLGGKKVRDELMKFLQERGIMSKVYFEPVHRYSIFRNLGYGKLLLPNTEKLSSQVLTLPMYPQLSRDDMDFIINSVKEFFDSDKINKSERK
jgi:perosamine synthetase